MAGRREGHQDDKGHEAVAVACQASWLHEQSAPVGRGNQAYKLLKRRNLFNVCHINKGKGLLDNSKIVAEGGPIHCPSLVFVSSGEGQEPNWVELQNKLAKDMNAKLVFYGCEHYIHHFQSENMACEIKGFMEALP
jgi:hypothetical protein